MPIPRSNLLATFALGLLLLVAAVLVFLVLEGPRGRDPRGAIEPPPGGPALAERLTALEQRLELERVPGPPASVRVDVDLLHRIELLEQRLDELSRALARLGTASQDGATATLGDTPALLAERGQLLRLAGNLTEEQNARLIRILRALLERHAGEEGSEGNLVYLVNALNRARQGDEARAAIDQFGSRVGLDPWRAEELRGGIAASARDHEVARRHYRAIQMDPSAPVHGRANAAFWEGYSYLNEGRKQEALETFRRLVQEYAGHEHPGVRNSVEAAERELAQLEGD